MFFLNRFSVPCNIFCASFLVTPCLVVAVKPCMEWIPIKTKNKKKTPSCVIITFTNCNFLNIMICSSIIFYWLIKEVSSADHNIVIFYFCSQKKISLVTFLSSKDKTKSLFTLWKLGSIKKSKNWFCTCSAILEWYLFQLIVLLKPDLFQYFYIILRW